MALFISSPVSARAAALPTTSRTLISPWLRLPAILRHCFPFGLISALPSLGLVPLSTRLWEHPARAGLLCSGATRIRRVRKIRLRLKLCCSNLGTKFCFSTRTLNLARAINTQAGRATIGIHNSGGLQSGQQLPWSYDAPVLANSTALQFSNQPTIVATSTTISSSLQPSILGQAVTLNAAVNPAAAGTATGTITFKDGATTLGSSALAGGKAMLTTAALSIGSHLLTAAYGADANFSASASAALTQNVTYNVCLLYDPTKSKTSGAAFPIKVEICDVTGRDLSSSGIVLHATGITTVSGFSGSADAEGNANPDSGFRFDSSLGSTGGYIFNLSTKGLSAGTYNLHFAVTGDPIGHSATFGVK